MSIPERSADPFAGRRGADAPLRHPSRRDREYPAFNARFAGSSAWVERIDTDPLRIVADAFLRARTIRTEPFHD